MVYDVVVVGAGPVGCRVAELTAKKGLKVALIDKKKEIGQPIQCTGLISYRLKSILPDLSKNVILNSVKRAKFFSNNVGLELKSKKPFYVVDREKLDNFIFLKAKRAGSDIGMPVLFKKFKKEKMEEEGKKGEYLILSTSEGKMQTKILVGADGIISEVARKAGLQRPSNMITGVQMTVESNATFDPGAVELFFSSTISPDFFGWVVPLDSDNARIGVAAKRGSTTYLKRLVGKRTGGKVTVSSVKPDVTGRINFGLMERTSAERVMVVGDAATQVKPFSGGGIVYGLLGAGYCANACIRAVKQNDFSADFFEREYDRKWQSHFAGSIKRGMLYRKFLYGFDDEISDTRTNFFFRLAKNMKFIVENFDVDLL